MKYEIKTQERKQRRGSLSHFPFKKKLNRSLTLKGIQIYEILSKGSVFQE